MGNTELSISFRPLFKDFDPKKHRLFINTSSLLHDEIQEGLEKYIRKRVQVDKIDKARAHEAVVGSNNIQKTENLEKILKK